MYVEIGSASHLNGSSQPKSRRPLKVINTQIIALVKVQGCVQSCFRYYKMYKTAKKYSVFEVGIVLTIPKNRLKKPKKFNIIKQATSILSSEPIFWEIIVKFCVLQLFCITSTIILQNRVKDYLYFGIINLL